MSVQTFSPNATLPRLLLGVSAEVAMDLQEHVALHGQLPSGRSASRAGATALIDNVEAAGLTGRGGAAFPTAAKVRAVADAAGRAHWLPVSRSRRGPIVVVNAAEGSRRASRTSGCSKRSRTWCSTAHRSRPKRSVRTR